MKGQIKGQKIGNLCQGCDTHERFKVLLDSTPLSCAFWDTECRLTDCNEEAVNLFGLSDKHQYLNRFFELSPEYQPDGSFSKEKAMDLVKKTFETGRTSFEWQHQKLNGEAIPCEVTLARLENGKGPFVAGYIRDLSALKASMEEAREANERVRLMLDATPLCCNFWDEGFNNIDCNEEAVKLFELSSKEEYLERFWELSPKKQPDGESSSRKIKKFLKKTFKSGRTSCEWMHQKLNGESIPTEVTLVRVKHKNGFNVVAYIRDLRELKKTVDMLDHLEKLAFTDELTGIYNRRYFIERARSALSASSLPGKGVSLVMMDLDFFKNVNDTYGHAAGDEALRSVAGAAQSVLRQNDVLARYGGEEFIVLLSESSQEAAVKLAERIRGKVGKSTFRFCGNEIKVSVSLGVATQSTSPMDLQDLIELADKALYNAKNKGRNCVEVL